MKNIVLAISLTTFSLNASQQPQSSPPRSIQEQDNPVNNQSKRLGLPLSMRIKQLNPSLNLDVSQLLASSNNSSNTPPQK